MRNFNLNEAIKRSQIVLFADGPKLIEKEIKAAKEELDDAKTFFNMGRLKAATASSYYSIFHSTRALLYAKKYREKSHIQLIRAVKNLYIDKGLLPEKYYDIFIGALESREQADYKRCFTKEGAERNINAATEVIGMVEILLKESR